MLSRQRCGPTGTGSSNNTCAKIAVVDGVTRQSFLVHVRARPKNLWVFPVLNRFAWRVLCGRWFLDHIILLLASLERLACLHALVLACIGECEDDKAHQDAATTDHFDDAEKALWSATARADAISAEIEYENSTEGEFSSAMERLGSRTISTSILVVFVELLLCVWQVSHLWSFFKREKLE